MFEMDMIQEAAKVVFSSDVGLIVKISAILMVVVGVTKKALESKKILGRELPDWGSFALLIGVSLVGGVANTLMAGGAMSWGLLGSSFMLAFNAAGGYTGFRKFLLPTLEKLADKAPGWLSIPLKVVLAVLGSVGLKAKKRAEKAGEEAVKANPGKGMEDVVGKPEDF